MADPLFGQQARRAEGRVPGETRLALLGLLDRVEHVLMEEEALLRKEAAGDYEHLIDRKAHLLLEAGRLGPHVGRSEIDSDLRDRIEAIKSCLERNARLLRINIEAAEELVGVVVGVISTVSGDGTYTGDVARRKLGP